MAKKVRIKDIVKGYRDDVTARCRELLAEGQALFGNGDEDFSDKEMILFLGRAETLCLQGRKYLHVNGLARDLEKTQ